MHECIIDSLNICVAYYVFFWRPEKPSLLILSSARECPGLLTCAAERRSVMKHFCASLWLDKVDAAVVRFGRILKLFCRANFAASALDISHLHSIKLLNIDTAKASASPKRVVTVVSWCWYTSRSVQACRESHGRLLHVLLLL